MPRLSKYKIRPHDPLPRIRWMSHHDEVLEKVAEYRYATTPMLTLVTGLSTRCINYTTRC